MKRIFGQLVILLVIVFPTLCHGADSVVVVSRTVTVGDTDVPIHIRVRNDVSIRGLIVPLVIREVDPGAFITQLSLGFRERLGGTILGQTKISNQYSAQDGTCQGDSILGFRTPVFDTVDVPYAVTANPWGVLLAAFGYPDSLYLPAGVDDTGSLVLTVDIATTGGTFEIDTVCVTPYNHLFYVNTVRELVTPSFSKGVISICDCGYHADLDGNGSVDNVDLSMLIDWVYFAIGPPPTDSTCPHVDRGDVDCSGFDDSVDVSLMVNIVFFGASACDPCACSPYPTSCP